MKQLKIGDRVKIRGYSSYGRDFDGYVGQITAINNVTVEVAVGAEIRAFRSSQLIKLKPKQKHPMEGKTFYTPFFGSDTDGSLMAWLTPSEKDNYSFNVSNIKKLK